jgi:hypothetical protein
MEPKYFIENRYSFVIDVMPLINNIDYEVQTPETAFEQSIQQQLAAANHSLMTGKYSVALAEYRHLRGIIAAVINPDISVIDGAKIDWSKIHPNNMIDVLLGKTGEILKNTPVPELDIPDIIRGMDVKIPENLASQFSVYEAIGIKDREVSIGSFLDKAGVYINNQNFAKAAEVLQSAVNATKDINLQGAIMHDTGILLERSGSQQKALESIKKSVELFGKAKNYEAQVVAVKSKAGIETRAGLKDAAKATLKNADTLRKKHNIFTVISNKPEYGNALRTDPEKFPSIGTERFLKKRKTISGFKSTTSATGIFPATSAAGETAEELAVQPVLLMAPMIYATRKTEKKFSVLDSNNNIISIILNDNIKQNLASFYVTLASTNDIGLLMGYLNSYTVTIAYLTHVFYWVIPMAMGDCLAALGSYQEAEQEYLSTLDYQYLNKIVESVNLWIRLAELYNDWGDRLYKQARNDVSEFSKAKQKYENIFRLDNTVNLNSPLYKSAKFLEMRNRVNAIIQSMFVNATTITENPRIIIALMRARMQLTKIAGELNYIGLGVHIPPFSFEYLQNIARYFTQHASQVEQMYIQFQSTGENEKLREQQMAQQAAIASASIELEERGLDEAKEGVDVAEANLNAAETQLENAVKAKNDFANVRWELLELDTLQAWASASAVDRDDQVKLTISGYSYYNTEKTRRNVVLQELANQRTRITHDLEANRLQREIDAANAYRILGQEQVQQANARVKVAEQRVAIAQMQEQYARENLEFLTGREFTSAMWYNLAREARRLSERYLDMAIEVATMMEKAYEAETGRDLRKIKFEYGLNHLNGMLGAEALLLDIDYFTLDHVRTKAKKAQMKQSVSLADNFPMAFERLLQTGTTFFETTLDHFDRRYPGFYLQKVKQVEVVLVGLNGTEGVHGTVRNIGISQFRTKSGAIVNQTYPADVMPLSEYNVRQDAIVFQLDNKDLRLFENNGVATMWQIGLPRATNTFDLRQILDIHLVIYYDGFFNNSLEQQILANLPAGGQASRGLSLRMYAPDELFYLRNNGSAEFDITPDLFPANQTEQGLSSYSLWARGKNVGGLKLRVNLDKLGLYHTYEQDADGYAKGKMFPALANKPFFDKWIFTIDPGDNPDFDLAGIEDLAILLEYNFKYKV